MKKLLLVIVYIFVFSPIHSQDKTDKYWNGKRSCVVLTYDDAMDSQLDYAIPVLDSLGIKATFYIPGHSESLYNRMDEWKAVAKEGHELGNHTIYHPCHGKSKNRNWVNPDHDLDNYSVGQFLDEIRIQNTLLKALDGKTKRTFAYTCGDLDVDGKDIAPYMKDYFLAARGVQKSLNYQGKINLYKLTISGTKNKSIEELKAQIDTAIKEKALLIFLFHGVEKGVPLNTTYAIHKELIQYIKSKENEIWVAPMIEVAEFVKANE